MYGTDIERVLLTVCKIKDLAADKLAELGTKSMYRMETIPHSHNVHVVINGGPHGHPTGAHSHDHWYTGHSPTGGTGMTGHVSDQLTYPQDYSDDMNPDHPHTQSSIIYEQEHEEVSMQFVSELLLMKDQLKEDAGRMDSISQDMYTDANTFNNTYGSPFQEIKNLMNKLEDIKTYTDQLAILQWQSQKLVLMNLLSVVVSYAVEAKCALIVNHDFAQRGYDDTYNGKRSSIAWDSFEQGATDGNRQDNSRSKSGVRTSGGSVQ